MIDPMDVGDTAEALFALSQRPGEHDREYDQIY